MFSFTFKHLGQGLALVLGRVAELDILVGVPGDSLPVQRDGIDGVAGLTLVLQSEGVWNVTETTNASAQFFFVLPRHNFSLDNYGEFFL